MFFLQKKNILLILLLIITTNLCSQEFGTWNVIDFRKISITMKLILLQIINLIII